MDGWIDGTKTPLTKLAYFDALRPKAVVACASHHLQSSPCTYLYINLQHPSVPFSPAFVLPWLVVDFADRDVEAGFARRIWLEKKVSTRFA